LLASTRSRYGWTTTLSTPFSSCYGKCLNLKKEEVCTRKQLLNQGISSLKNLLCHVPLSFLAISMGVPT
jgi:hypothetical protein